MHPRNFSGKIVGLGGKGSKSFRIIQDKNANPFGKDNRTIQNPNAQEGITSG
jgi:hypothetical protein